MSKNQNAILLFDGVCNLCNGIVRFIINRDSKQKFRFAPLQSDSGQTLMKKWNLNPAQLDTSVLIIGNNLYLKSSAALQVCKELGGLWQILFIFILIPRPFRDFVYDWVAKNRIKIFGKSESCMLPTPDIKSRFLE